VGSDPDLELIKKWGVQDPRGPYAKPSTFVIKKGDIVYRYIGQNKKDRPPVDEILEAVRSKR
jgi:peroxiredoxin